MVSFMGERNAEAGLGVMMGFTCLGFSKGPNIHSRPCPRAGPPANAASEHHSAAGTRKLIIPGPPGDAGTVVRRLSPHGCRVTCGPARVGATMPRPRSAGCDHGVSPMMCIFVEAMSLSVFGSGRSDVKTVAVFVNRRSLSGGFRIGVATNVAVTLAPVASVSTAQKDRPPKFPRAARECHQVQRVRQRVSKHDARRRLRTKVGQRDRKGDVLPDTHNSPIRHLGECEVGGSLD